MRKGLLNPDAEFLSLAEICKLFSPPVSKVSLWKWMRQGQLQLTAYSFGRNKFYKRAEVIAELERHRTDNPGSRSTAIYSPTKNDINENR